METPWSTRRAPSRALLIAAGIAGALTLLAMLTVDAPIARAIHAYQPASIWSDALTACEWAILLPLHPLVLPVALVVGLLVTMIVPRWRGAAPAWMLVAGVHLYTRLTTNWIKDATGRYRPGEWFKHGEGDTFGHFGVHPGVSFPSGHVVLFASLLVPLLLVVPARFRRVVIAANVVIVGFVGAQRMAMSAHFLSDVLGAITYVLLWTYLCALVVRPQRAR